MSGTVRAEAPGRLFELVRALGGSPERVRAAAGVTAANFADPDRPIEVETALRLMDAAAHEVGDDHFGLHAGGLMDYGTLGVLTYAVLNAPTVGTALRNFERYARSHFRGPRIRLETDGDEARLELVLDVAGGVARRLGLSVRTLQRRLGEERTVFKTLVEDVRRELALRYLADGRTRLTDVAFLVGYSELSAFGRAFHRWTGSTPLAMRRSLTSASTSRA